LNSAAGCGKPVIQGFLDQIGATSLPAFLRTILDQLKEAARRDLQSDEGKAIAARLMEHPELFGSKEISQYALANKVHFIGNCIFERTSMDAVDPGLAEVALLASDESDGKYVVPFVGHAPVASWLGAVRGACSGSGQWDLKPYDTKDAIIEKMKAANPQVPAHLWDLRDDWWLEHELKSIQCRRRLRIGENPAMFLADCIPNLQRGSQYGSMLVKEAVLTYSSSKDAVDYYLWQVIGQGGRWTFMPGKIANSKLESIAQNLVAGYLGVDVLNFPGQWVNGKPYGSITSRLPAQLYDSGFASKMNGIASYKYLQFSCGNVMLRDHSVKPATPDMFCGLTTGYPLTPDLEAKFDKELQQKGINLGKTLRDVRQYEASLGSAMKYEKLPQKLADELDKIRAFPEFVLLDIVWKIFEDWPLCLSRGGKVFAAAVFAEEVTTFVVDHGYTGQNGKTFLMRIMEVLIGDYADQAKQSMLTQPPPKPGSPAPDLLALRGKRALCAPEFETTESMKSAWLKAAMRLRSGRLGGFIPTMKSPGVWSASSSSVSMLT